jgi:small subunit ribosomal protein S3
MSSWGARASRASRFSAFPSRLAITIVTAKPGVVIGRRGANVNALKAKLESITGVSGKNLRLDVVEVERPEVDAHLVAESVAEQLERRVSQKRAMRQAIHARHARRCQGHQDRLLRPSVGRPRWRGASGRARGACPCTPARRY